jgi:hypothetical protein
MNRNTLAPLLAAILALSAAPLVLRAQDDPRMKFLDMGTRNGVPYLSGGIGLDEREYITQMLARDYNFKLELAAANGDYISNVDVRITDSSGRVVLQVGTGGPWLFARLSPGRYRVEATAQGRTFEKTVTIGGESTARLVFREW